MGVRFLVSAVLGATAFFAVSAAEAATVGFVDSPLSNSQDWTVTVGLNGQIINHNVNFNAMPTGALDGNFYAATDGVTISASGNVGNVAFGSGPGQFNTSDAQPGEGVHSASNFLTLGSTASSLTFNFNRLVYGAGLFTLDVFQSEGLEIEAFTGLNASGDSLGVFSAIAGNFQQNNLYFLGLISDIGFRSFVFRRTNSSAGDIFGVDDFVFATDGEEVTAVPLPAAGWLFLAGLGGLGMSAWNRKRLTA